MPEHIRVRPRTIRSALRASLLASFLSVIVACGGGGGDGPTGGSSVASVVLNAPSLSMIQGDTATLVATARDAAGSVVAGSVAWKSSAATVATVASTGLVTAVAPGSTTITATVGGKSVSLAATVTAAPNAVTVTMPAGDIFSPFRAVIAAGGRVNWQFPARAHNVLFDRRTGAPSDIATTSGATVSRTFATAGVFSYACSLHLPGMTGEVEVR